MAGVGRGWEVERGCLSLRAIYSVQYVPVAGDLAPTFVDNAGISFFT